jgi:hypothetical protein
MDPNTMMMIVKMLGQMKPEQAAPQPPPPAPQQPFIHHPAPQPMAQPPSVKRMY